MSDPTEEAYRWRIGGRVQGVGFRWFVLKRASSLGVAGWARNLPDGRVEVAACGPTAALAELEQSLRVGPRAARVDNVEKADIPHESITAKSFGIR